MSVEAFVDTNVLVYATTGAGDELAKREIAVELLKRGNFGLSAQVLQEFFVTVTRKTRLNVAEETAHAWVRALDPVPCVAIDRDLVHYGMALAQRYRVSYWDATIIAAGEALGARTLYSEDFNHGQVYGALRVENPFLKR